MSLADPWVRKVVPKLGPREILDALEVIFQREFLAHGMTSVALDLVDLEAALSRYLRQEEGR